MKPQDIVVGGVYRNCGKGRTQREILKIAGYVGIWCYVPVQSKSRVCVLWRYVFPDGVGPNNAMSLESFAAWAGARVDESKTEVDE